MSVLCICEHLKSYSDVTQSLIKWRFYNVGVRFSSVCPRCVSICERVMLSVDGPFTSFAFGVIWLCWGLDAAFELTHTLLVIIASLRAKHIIIFIYVGPTATAVCCLDELAQYIFVDEVIVCARVKSEASSSFTHTYCVEFARRTNALIDVSSKDHYHLLPMPVRISICMFVHVFF